MKLTGFPTMEGLQVVRYHQAQQYKYHYDWFQHEMGMGHAIHANGQRTVTIFAYCTNSQSSKVHVALLASFHIIRIRAQFSLFNRSERRGSWRGRRDGVLPCKRAQSSRAPQLGSTLVQCLAERCRGHSNSAFGAAHARISQVGHEHVVARSAAGWTSGQVQCSPKNPVNHANICDKYLERFCHSVANRSCTCPTSNDIAACVQWHCVPAHCCSSH